MQIYRRMDIGTAKPTREEMDGVPHHMIDVADPGGGLLRRALPPGGGARGGRHSRPGKAAHHRGRNRLYLDALLNGHDFAVKSTGWREKLQKKYDEEGIQPPLGGALTEIDPSPPRLHPMDTKRVIRALEFWYETERPSLRPQRRQPAAAAPLHGAEAGAELRIAPTSMRALTHGWRRWPRPVWPTRCAPAGKRRQLRLHRHAGHRLQGAVRGRGGQRRPDGGAGRGQAALRQYAKRQLTWFRRDRTTQWYRHGSQPDPEALRRFAAEKLAEAGIQ